MTTTKLTITQASSVTGRGRTTLTRHMKEGKIAFEKNDQGHRVIDASELTRVYGAECDFDLIDGKRNSTSRSEKQASEGAESFKALKEQYEARILDLKEALEKSDRAMLLLEDHSTKAGEWKQAISELKAEVANETKTDIRELKEVHDKELRMLKRALSDERSKSLWQKLFG